MNETITTVFWSATVSVILTTTLVWLLRNWITERLKNSIRYEYEKDLESHKAALKGRLDAELEAYKGSMQRGFHVYKSQFDMEFASFQKLWAAIAALVDQTARIANLYRLRELPEGRGERKKVAEEADALYFSTIAKAQEVRPFIPKNIHVLSSKLAGSCKREIDEFFQVLRIEEAKDYDAEKASKEAQASMQIILNLWDELADGIRERLSALSMREDG